MQMAVVEERPVTFSAEQLDAALDSFRGDTLQVPSMYSALKYQGKSSTNMHVRALRFRAKLVRLPCMSCCSFVTKVMNSSWKYTVRKGPISAPSLMTSVKSWAAAHVIYLRRLAVSKYPVERMVTLEHLHALIEQAQAQGVAPADLLDPLLMPMDSPAVDFPVVNLPLTSSVYFKNGNPVRTTGHRLRARYA